MACGAAQFLSQPFLVGDRVEVATGNGARVLTGVIERIDPMRTIVRSDAEVPITIPNKASVTNGCVCNASHCIGCSHAVDSASGTSPWLSSVPLTVPAAPVDCIMCSHAVDGASRATALAFSGASALCELRCARIVLSSRIVLDSCRVDGRPPAPDPRCDARGVVSNRHRCSQT